MQFPSPVRAVVGLLASAADEAKHLPDRAVELPMLAVSTALQMSLRAQQRYARLAARGDEVLNRRHPTDDPPPWATFDEPVSVDELRPNSPADDEARAAAALLDELLGVAEGPTVPDPADADPAGAAPADAAPPKTAPPVAKKAPAKRTPANSTSPVPKAAAPAKDAAAKTPAKKTVPAKKPKSVSKPRHVAPSRFDAVDDE